MLFNHTDTTGQVKASSRACQLIVAAALLLSAPMTATAQAVAALGDPATVDVQPQSVPRHAAPWEARRFDYAVVDQDLRELLVEFGRRVGLGVSVSDAVRGRVRGRLPSLPPRELLGHLAAVHGFDWFVDGATLHVSTMGESTSRLVDLGPVPAGELEEALRALGILDPRWPLRAAGGGLGLALIAGPPRYVSLVEQTLAALARRPRRPEGAVAEPAAPLPIEVRVFRGRKEDRS
jgi:type III secretion protein C